MAIKVLRQYLPTSVSTLLQLIKDSDPVFEITLKVYAFYDGWKDFHAISTALRKFKIDFTVLVNGEEKKTNYADELKTIIKGIEKSDIY